MIKTPELIKVIGIIGTRRRDSSVAYEKVEKKFFKLYQGEDWICSGGCPKGGDRFAEIIAKKYGIPIMIFYPNFKKYGSPAALFIRNTDVAISSDKIIACISKDRKGGTEDTIKKFLKNNPKKNLFLV